MGYNYDYFFIFFFDFFDDVIPFLLSVRFLLELLIPAKMSI